MIFHNTKSFHSAVMFSITLATSSGKSKSRMKWPRSGSSM